MEDPLTFQNNVVDVPYTLPIPPLDNDYLLFPAHSDVITVDFPFNVDFDFTFDDLSVVDDLLLEQPDSINPTPPFANPSPSEGSNSNFGGYSTNHDVSSSFILLINHSSHVNDHVNDDDYNLELCYKFSNQDGANDSSNANGNANVNDDDDNTELNHILITHDDGNYTSCSGGDKNRRKRISVDNRKCSSRGGSSNGSGGGSLSGIGLKSKRKQEGGQDHGSETRVNKFRRLNVSVEHDHGSESRMDKGRRRLDESVVVGVIASEENVDGEVGEVGERFSVGGGGDKDDKKKARLLRNRESAQLSRQRKKKYVEELEDKFRVMVSTITDLNGRISYFMTENATLRQQLSGGVAASGVVPPPGMYLPPLYPWMACPPPYMVKPQGSHVSLVPIPRLKPQQPKLAPKVKKEKKEKIEGKKTKKVASVSLIGLLFFMLMFGGLVSMVNVRYGRDGDGVDAIQSGSVFKVVKHTNERVLKETNSSSGENTSEPLIASLYVPRNDKLVKIDGNLIIHSVLATEKALAEGPKTSKETSLAIHRSYPPYPTPGPGSNNWRRPHLHRNQNGRQRGLGSGSTDGFTPIGYDGTLQQWFREGLAGPMLSSGMCTEVFQFDTSPTPGSIVSATSGTNITSEDRLNSTRPMKTKNRRILHEHTNPLKDHNILNATEEHVHPPEQTDGLESNKSHSSIVVSVFVDPREVGDGDGETDIGSKTLPQIFVVVLNDSVKYVTYSFMLPFLGSGSHASITACKK